MTFKVIHEVDRDEWQEIADCCEYATFFQTPLWYEIFAQTYPNMSIATKKFIFDNQQVVIFPVMKMLKYLRFINVSKYISSPAWVYGGWISKTTLEKKQCLDIIKWVKNNLGDLFWRINPFDRSLLNDDFSNYQFQQKKDFTQYLDLTIGYEKIRKNFSRGHRKNINKAKRLQVEHIIATNKDHWQQYYQLYQDNLQVWDNKATNAYPWELFDKLSKQSQPQVKLYLALIEEQIVSGALIFSHNNHVAGWHGVTNPDFRSYHPWHLLMNQIIYDLCQKQYQWFDFHPSGGHQGVV